MSGNVFVTDQFLLDAGFAAARRELGCLAGDGVLLGAAEYAYNTAVTGLMQATPGTAQPSRLAGVWPADISDAAGCARLPLRWEAISADGALFPALDADLTLTSAGGNTTLLALAGVYRLPDQPLAGLDPALVRCFADLTIRAFIARLACAITHPAGAGLGSTTPGAGRP
jgi:hypothetical protein